MAREADPLDLIGSKADERLLGEDRGHLPAGMDPAPQPLPESQARRQVVRFGATMTGVTLVGGVALALLGLIETIADGGLGWVAVLVLGLILVTTHWGWVHVAELTGNRIEASRHASLDERRQHWLSQIEPYPRWEVRTRADPGGEITIETVVYRPVPRGERRFSFTRELASREVHPAEEPAAEVTERAELLRRQAAAATRQAREQFEVANDAYERALIASDDEEQRRAALQAASEALSERINANLSDPPLTE
ncbi:MAG TPA: hypothetical protein VMD09_09485 [Solirubrobacteraceae bacterium]|nr:hypothetical protein [Solirubrobacteraceae bacterium]